MVCVYAWYAGRGASTNKSVKGYINNGEQRYSDASGFNVDTQVLVFKVRLPEGSDISGS